MSRSKFTTNIRITIVIILLEGMVVHAFVNRIITITSYSQ
jgi:hypothetical protein